MLTLLLAKVIGLYYAIAGVALIVRQKEIRAAERKFPKDGMMRISLALLVLLASLFLITGYYDFSSFPSGLLTVIGWMIFFKALVLLFLSDESVEKLIKYFDHKNWYTGAGAVVILMGLYLACFGFGYV